MRRRDLDWVRGVAVLIMIEAHVFDSWTAPTERAGELWRFISILGGCAAPLFLLMAGVSASMSAASKQRKGATIRTAAAAVWARGWFVFGLALIFRLQSWILSPGVTIKEIFTVDILNVLGLGIAGAALVWGAARTVRWRVAAFSLVAAAIALSTPLVRNADLLQRVPAPFVWYLRPWPGQANFSLFPWIAFVFVGGAIGVLVDARRGEGEARRLALWTGAAGAAIAATAYALSFRPSIYPQSSFWHTSPTFFFVRVGGALMLLALAYAWDRRPGREHYSPLQQFGRTSLFVYWVHVELMYGVYTRMIQKQLTLSQCVTAYVVLTTMMFALSVLKDRVVARWREARPWKMERGPSGVYDPRVSVRPRVVHV